MTDTQTSARLRALNHRWARPRGIWRFIFRRTRRCSRCGASVSLVGQGPRGGRRYKFTPPGGGSIITKRLPTCAVGGGGRALREEWKK
jgi:hypothetical protein